MPLKWVVLVKALALLLVFAVCTVVDTPVSPAAVCLAATPVVVDLAFLWLDYTLARRASAAVAPLAIVWTVPARRPIHCPRPHTHTHTFIPFSPAMSAPRAAVAPLALSCTNPYSFSSLGNVISTPTAGRPRWVDSVSIHLVPPAAHLLRHALEAAQQVFTAHPLLSRARQLADAGSYVLVLQCLFDIDLVQLMGSATDLESYYLDELENYFDEKMMGRSIAAGLLAVKAAIDALAQGIDWMCASTPKMDCMELKESIQCKTKAYNALIDRCLYHTYMEITDDCFSPSPAWHENTVCAAALAVTRFPGAAEVVLGLASESPAESLRRFRLLDVAKIAGGTSKELLRHLERALQALIESFHAHERVQARAGPRKEAERVLTALRAAATADSETAPGGDWEHTYTFLAMMHDSPVCRRFREVILSADRGPSSVGEEALAALRAAAAAPDDSSHSIDDAAP